MYISSCAGVISSFVEVDSLIEDLRLDVVIRCLRSGTAEFSQPAHTLRAAPARPRHGQRLLACGAHESAAYQQPITTSDVKKAISLQNRLQRVRQKMAVASATEITSGPAVSQDAQGVGEETGILIS
jgi:hypothetical protein